MKKSMFFSALFVGAFFLHILSVSAGKPFEGVITFKISYPENKFTESQLAMFPKVVTVSIKGSKSRTDMQMSGMNTVEITDFKEKSKVSLLNLMGQKYAIRQTKEEIAKELDGQPVPSVEITAETKVIAGYTCKKAVVSVNDDGVKSTFEAWFTEEIGGGNQANFDSPLYKDIDGVLLEFTMKTNDFNMKFTASSIEKKSLPAKDFEIPSDYTITTQEELKSKFGGGE